MRVEAVKDLFDPIMSYLPVSDRAKYSMYTLAARTATFFEKNKSTLFLVTTIAFTIVATPAPFANVKVVDSIVRGMLIGATLQGVALFFGRGGYSDLEDRKLNLILGGINLSAWFLDHSSGVATSMLNLGVKGCGIAYKKLIEFQE